MNFKRKDNNDDKRDFSELLAKLIESKEFINSLNGLKYRVYEFKSSGLIFYIHLN